MKEETIKVLICEPGKVAYLKDIPNDNGDTMREIVGGYVETHHPFWAEDTKETRDLYVVCNEDGKYLDLPMNRSLVGEDGNVYDILSGTFLISSLNRDTGYFCSLSPAQVRIAMETFGLPEAFRNIEELGIIYIVPYMPHGEVCSSMKEEDA